MDIERVYETDVADHTRTAALPEGVLRVTLEDFEALHKVSLGVILPPLDKLKLETVRALRAELKEEFIRSQNVLFQFSQESESCQDPERFREIFQKTEEGVRALQRSLESIQHRRTMAAAAAGFAVGIICVLMAPSLTLAKAIASILASSAISKATLVLLPPRSFGADPFIFPLRIMEAAHGER